ncbi:MAG: hypothetical protein IPI30_18580 [Saprospiraceae bacterium]|nr:hypothetical protein [Candidatus Vicinibacter affinis]
MYWISTLAGVDTIPTNLDPMGDRGPLFAIFSPNGASQQGLSLCSCGDGSCRKTEQGEVPYHDKQI